MSEETDLNIIDAINIAMRAENEARRFYNEAAQKVSDPQGRNLLVRLAAFERYHFDKLDELLRSLESTGAYVEYEGIDLAAVEPRSEIALTGEATPEEVLDILSMAIKAEKSAEARYRHLAGATTSESGQKMFRRLADEEATHQRILNDEFYSLSNKGVWVWME